MQTNFSLAQLADADLNEAESILRKCVHCGFCTATCPTFALLGDELDSPRGRIYLLKDMLENDRPANELIVRHVDRCLSCLSCMTTCPSGVNYMHLVDYGRRRIEETYARPFLDRLLRATLAWVIPSPTRFRAALGLAGFAKPFGGWLPGNFGKQVRAMLSMVPSVLAPPSPVDRPQSFQPSGQRRKRVALLSGCAQKVLSPQINEATVRLLTRHGVEVVVAQGAGCCGSLTHHMGKEEPTMAAARTNIEAWSWEIDGDGLDAIIINASGCGTTIKDYGFMFREDPALAAKAARIAELARDVSEFMLEIELAPVELSEPLPDLTYHSACSMQHGQGLKTQAQTLLRAAGFQVREPAEGHLCCGSAGTYNLLQPELADRLKARKLANIAATAPQVVATGNIGCIKQLADGAGVPVVHTVELLDWATGGPPPTAMEEG